VVIPGVIFLVIFLWPWIDRRLTHDRTEHHVLQNPREKPLRVAIGVYGLTLVGVLLVAGGNDVFARILHVPLLTIIYVMRTVVLVLPFLAAAIAYAVTRALLRSHAEALSDMPAKALVSDVDLREEEESEEPPPEAEPPFVLLRRRPVEVPPESELHHATPGDAPGDEL
jgi:ubiquinol-cytochrome c reductase cytochrome b subunit